MPDTENKHYKSKDRRHKEHRHKDKEHREDERGDKKRRVEAESSDNDTGEAPSPTHGAQVVAAGLGLSGRCRGRGGHG